MTGRRTPWGAVELPFLAEELLEAEIEMRAAARPPPVDHGARAQHAPVGERHLRRRDIDGRNARQQALAEARRDDVAEPLRRDRGVARAEAALALGEAHVVVGPARGDEGGDPVLLGRAEIAVVEAPGVVAAERIAPFDHEHRKLGPAKAEAVGDQPVGETAAQKDDVGVEAHAGSTARARRGAGQAPAIQSSTACAALAAPPASPIAAPMARARRRRAAVSGAAPTRPPPRPARAAAARA